MKGGQLIVGDLSSFNPTVNFANHLIAQPKQKWGPRIIPDSQLLYIISGKASLQLGNQSFQAKAGDCLFYGEESPHSIYSSKNEPVEFYSIHFAWKGASLKP